MINTRCVLRVYLNDNWVEIKILTVAHKLLIEKYDFDQNRCQFGNFANVPTTGCMKLKHKCDICVFYKWMEEINHIIHNLCTL